MDGLTMSGGDVDGPDMDRPDVPASWRAPLDVGGAR